MVELPPERGGCIKTWIMLSCEKMKHLDIVNFGFPTSQWYLFKFHKIIDYSFQMTEGND